MLADVFAAEVATVNVTEGAAFGAALLAAVGAGVFADVPSACATAVRETFNARPIARSLRSVVTPGERWVTLWTKKGPHPDAHAAYEPSA